MKMQLRKMRRRDSNFERVGRNLFQIDGVVGVGVSRDDDGTPVIEVYFDSEERRARAQITAHVENVPTRPVVTGSFSAF